MGAGTGKGFSGGAIVDRVGVAFAEPTWNVSFPSVLAPTDAILAFVKGVVLEGGAAACASAVCPSISVHP